MQTAKDDLLKERNSLLRRGLLVEYLSLAWMSVEGLVAMSAGFLTGSLAMLAFGGDSFIELISSYAVLTYLRKTLRNPTGSRRELATQRVEHVTALLLVALIPMIALGGAYSYLYGVEPESSLAGIAVAVGAVVIMPVLWVQKRRIGREANCVPLSIDAAESATCFFMSTALLSGLLINYFLNLPWIDYVATTIILAFVGKEAAESLREVTRKAD